MSQFALFAGDHYYPSGGWGDFRGVFDTIDSARAAFISGQSYGQGIVYHYDWGQIVDLTSLEVVVKL